MDTTQIKNNDDTVRLARMVLPEHYSLTLVPDFDSRTYRGQVEIRMLVHEKTRRIEMHAHKELTIQSVVVLRGGERLVPEKIDRVEDEQRLILTFSDELSFGEMILEIEFDGVLNNDMAGFYASTYQKDAETHVLGTTQFEATDARRAFPCWDEPDIKATFDVCLEILKELTALSNMPMRTEEAVGEDKKRARFETTPLMSTYLLAWVIGALECNESATKEGIRVRVFTTLGKKDQGNFACDAAKKMLSFYSTYFGIAYPLPKLDLVAIPDFATGAMENWGLVTYRETAILVDPARTSERAKQFVALVVAHELAHQWFGNLVTMRWWTHLWLNEGFASWVEYLGVDAVFPEWNIWEHFASADYARALAKDSLRKTHPIEVPIRHTREIDEIFDALSYSKGASVIRMLDAYLGREVFQRGLTLYLTRHQYGNATTEDLWAALAEASGKKVKEAMDTWTKQPGYPVITLMQGSNEGEYEYEQNRFLQSGEALSVSEASQIWHISFHGHDRAPILLTNKKGTLTLSGDAASKLNTGHIAFARIAYSSDLQEALIAAMARGELSSIDRFGLSNDFYALTRAGIRSTPELLSFLELFRVEEDLIVWEDLLATLQGISLIVPVEGEVRELFNNFGHLLVESIAKKMGWDEREGESQKNRLLRPMVLFASGSFGDTDVISEAQSRFARYRTNPETLHPNLYGPVFNLAALSGDEGVYNDFLSCYRRVEHPEQKNRLLTALGFFQDEALLRRALDFSLSDEVRRQDGMHIPRAIAANDAGRELGWASLRDQWKKYRERYAGSLSIMFYILEPVLGVFKTEERAREIEDFFKKNPYPEAERTIEQSLEKTRARARWCERDYDAMVTWLRAWAKKNSL